MDSRLMMKNLRGIAKSRMVTLKIPAGNTSPSLSFPDQPDLRYARILGIEAFCDADMAQSIPDNLPVIGAANLPQIALTLETNDADEWYENVPEAQNANNTGRFRTTSQNIKWQPLITFHRVLNLGVTPSVFDMFEFNNIFVTWEKSFITMPTPISPVADTAVIIQVYYTFRSIYGKLITRT